MIAGIVSTTMGYEQAVSHTPANSRRRQLCGPESPTRRTGVSIRTLNRKPRNGDNVSPAYFRDRIWDRTSRQPATVNNPASHRPPNAPHRWIGFRGPGATSAQAASGDIRAASVAAVPVTIAPDVRRFMSDSLLSQLRAYEQTTGACQQDGQAQASRFAAEVSRR